MTTIIKPMEAHKSSIKDVRFLSYPLVVQKKHDGVRLLVNAELVGHTASGKDVSNFFIRAMLRKLPTPPVGYNYDGELVLAANTSAEKPFQALMSLVMAEYNTAFMGDLWYSIFDLQPTIPQTQYVSYEDRRLLLSKHLAENSSSELAIAGELGDIVNVYEEVVTKYVEAEAQGWEGLMLRSLAEPYKFGRSTLSDQALIKVKVMDDVEGTIVGFVRATGQYGDPKQELGALIVQTPSGATFNVGTGFTAAQRKEWADASSLIGKVCTVEFLKAGVKDAPRQPVFKGLRYDKQ